VEKVKKPFNADVCCATASNVNHRSVVDLMMAKTKQEHREDAGNCAWLGTQICCVFSDGRAAHPGASAGQFNALAAELMRATTAASTANRRRKRTG
jgi:hypothetical protein